MLIRLPTLCILAALTASGSSAMADATLVYELAGPAGVKTVKHVALARFWARVNDAAEEDRFLLFQAGKFFPVYAVDESRGTYALLTEPARPFLGSGTTARSAAKSGPAQSPAPAEGSSEKPEAGPEDQRAGSRPAGEGASSTDAAAQEMPEGSGSTAAGPDAAFEHPILKPTGKTRTVAGIRCRVAIELVNDEPVIEHCMANTARLRVSDRELITLSRLFAMARKLNMGWLGAPTEDERFVSVQSRELEGGKTLELKSVSREPLPPAYFRIPRTYQRQEGGAGAQ